MTVSLLFGSSLNTDENFSRGCSNFTAYVDLHKAFNSVNLDALWRILGLCGVPPKLINLISVLYSGTESAVRCDGCISDLFPISTGVLQGCVLAPMLSVLVWTGFWGRCQRDQAAVHRLGMLRSLTLISQIVE